MDPERHEWLSNMTTARKEYPFYPDAHDYYTYPALYRGDYRPAAVRNAVIMYLSYLPVLFIAFCAKRDPRIHEYYKTTIVFSAYAQFFLTLPQTIFYTWISIAVMEDYETTIIWCSVVKLNTAALNFMSYNTLVAVGFCRLISLFFGRRLELAFVLAAFTFFSALLVAIVGYMFAVNSVYPHEVCQPVIFFLEDIPALIHNFYTFFIPLLAAIFNLLCVIYLIYMKSRRTTVSPTKKVDELVVAFSLLLQSIIPAVTITSKAFFVLTMVWLVEAPDWFIIFTNWAGFFTTGLNILASIVFIKSFQDQFKELFWFPIKYKVVRPDPTTTTSFVLVKI